ncbi:hypothetical protein ERJ75_000650800 [Trypanosoma vivax]|nr:hypothetical protein ERJ75_000650800 [Trypanosoma vivax]
MTVGEKDAGGAAEAATSRNMLCKNRTWVVPQGLKDAAGTQLYTFARSLSKVLESGAQLEADAAKRGASALAAQARLEEGLRLVNVSRSEKSGIKAQVKRTAERALSNSNALLQLSGNCSTAARTISEAAARMHEFVHMLALVGTSTADGAVKSCLRATQTWSSSNTNLSTKAGVILSEVYGQADEDILEAALMELKQRAGQPKSW